MRSIRLACLICLAGLPAAAEVYEVGPDQTLQAVGQVPWESLQAGDEVRIHWREQAYFEKFVIGRRGEQAAPIVVRGVPGPRGQLPVLDGRDATTRSGLNYWNEDRGLVKIGGSNQPPDTTPAWIVIENLCIRSARPPHTFTGRDGLTAYRENAAAVYIEKGEHIVLRGLEIADSGNGLFCAAATRDLLVEGCWIHDNGMEDDIYVHNNYTEALGIVFQYNHFGPLREACRGSNLKDRSAGLIVRYNWIEGGNRQLDLVDAEDSAELVAHPSYRQTFVYGNVLIEPDGAGNSQILHYGGDSGTTSDYRKGTLFFHYNTVVSTRSGNTTLMRLSTNDELAECRNNVIYTTEPGQRLAMLDATGQLSLRHNWLRAGWRDSHSGLVGSIDDDGSNLTGEAPGFEDLASQDFHLAEGSACIDRGGALHPDVVPDHLPGRQYVRHQRSENRPDDGQADIGGFELCPPGGCEAPDGGPIDADGGEADADGDGGGDGGEGGDWGGDESLDAGDGSGPAADRGDPAGGERGDAVSGGCGCASSGPAPSWWLPILLGLLAIAAGRSRRA
ncbi:MAG: polysaccharide-degrading enzyme [Deltaproteobacteria bacterium]|nr:polysaccharide-degrading enzyme [Deltaproteobacteria bacterium]